MGLRTDHIDRAKQSGKMIAEGARKDAANLETILRGLEDDIRVAEQQVDLLKAQRDDVATERSARLGLAERMERLAASGAARPAPEQPSPKSEAPQKSEPPTESKNDPLNLEGIVSDAVSASGGDEKDLPAFLRKAA